jgi:ribosomal protein S21
MVTDQQVRRMLALMNQEKTKATAAAKAGMDPKTALKYRKLDQLPSQAAKPHTWRTRQDPFTDSWNQVKELLDGSPGLEAKTIFDHLQRSDPGRYQDGQLRTLQRRIKYWRGLEGPAKEVFFPQIHRPGILCASDFTHMTSLGITIHGEILIHLAYHFVLTYSNWENVSLCYSESFESLSGGLQKSLWALGGVPDCHRSDRMSSAVHKDCHPEKFTARYQALLRHYGMQPLANNPNSGNENGDVEQAHRRFKTAVDQALLLRGSRNFENRQAYEAFLEEIVHRRNSGRRERFLEELGVLKKLPVRRMDDCTYLEKTVGSSSTIQVLENTYSVHSRLIGEHVEIRMHLEHLEVWYAQKLVERIPRLRGRGNHRIDYRHIIGWLLRKPGAFANYRYRSDMFPTSYFRMAYDELKRQNPFRADKEYIRILKIASSEGQATTHAVIRDLLSGKERLSADAIEQSIQSRRSIPPVTDVMVREPDLAVYDDLLAGIIR